MYLAQMLRVKAAYEQPVDDEDWKKQEEEDLEEDEDEDGVRRVFGFHTKDHLISVLFFEGKHKVKFILREAGHSNCVSMQFAFSVHFFLFPAEPDHWTTLKHEQWDTRIAPRVTDGVLSSMFWHISDKYPSFFHGPYYEHFKNRNRETLRSKAAKILDHPLIPLDVLTIITGYI